MHEVGLLARRCWRTRAARCARGDDVTVLPSLLHRVADGTLHLRIDAWVYERERNPTRTRLLAARARARFDEMTAPERERFSRARRCSAPTPKTAAS